MNLAATLKWLQSKMDGVIIGASYHHGTFEDFYITGADSTMGIINYWYCKWDLDKSFNDQSEETKKVLTEIASNNGYLMDDCKTISTAT